MTRPVLRPCWFVGVLWLCVGLICPFLSDAVQWIVLAVCAALAVISLCIPRVRHVHAVPLAAVTCVVAIAAFQIACFMQVRVPKQWLGKPQELHVQAIEVDQGLLLETVDGEQSGVRFRYYPQEKGWEIELYDRFTATFTLAEYRSETPFQAAVARAQGVWLIAESADETAMRMTQQAGSVPRSRFAELRQSLCTVVEQALEGDIGALVTGICFGQTERLSSATVSDFRACGVSHLFSVSGLHMAVLVRGVAWLLRRLRIRRAWRAVVSVAFLLCFMALVGFSPSVVRSGLVCIVATLGDCLRRQADTKNSLGLALLLLLVPQPFAAYDVGLLLSFAATYGLVCWTPTIRRCITGGFVPKRLAGVWNFMITSLSVSLAALLATLPITAVFFGRVSLLSVPTNLLTVMPSEGLLIGGCLAALLSVVGLSVLAQPLFFIVGCFSRCLLWACEIFSTFSFATVAIRVEFLVLLIVGVYAVFLFGKRFLTHHGQCGLLGVCLCLLCVGILLNNAVHRNRLRVQAVSDKNVEVVMTYRGQTVVVVSPKQIGVPYRLRTALDEAGSSGIDVLCLVGGDEAVVASLPSALDEYVTTHTQVLYYNLPWRSPWKGIALENVDVTLGDALSVQEKDGLIWLDWESYRIVASMEPCDRLPEQADIVLTVGDTPIRVRSSEGEHIVSADVSAIMADGK